LSDGKTELRYVPSKLFLASAALNNIWELTTDPETLPKNAKVCVMTHIEALHDRKLAIYMV